MAGEPDIGVRADVFVAAHYPAFSRSSLDTLFESGAVLINDKTAKAGYKLRLSDVVSVDDSLLRQAAPVIELPILYEDADVMVINKPAGILTHSKGALNLEGTVASFIKPKITDKTLSGNRAGIVHRLDRGTSGVIIAAKNTKALHWLQKQFSQRNVKKSYLAIVEGNLKPPHAVIEAPIARNPKKPQTFTVSPVGRPATTEYEVKRSFIRSGKTYSLVELKPLTGRTHQLRVHLAYISHPIVGDNVYGHNGQPTLLHAESLELTLPSGERKVFKIEPPAYFKEFYGLD